MEWLQRPGLLAMRLLVASLFVDLHYSLPWPTGDEYFTTTP